MIIKDIGILLSLSRFEENKMILKILSMNYGIVKGISTIKNSARNYEKPLKGSVLFFEQYSRLPHHLGKITYEEDENMFIKNIIPHQNKTVFLNYLFICIEEIFKEYDSNDIDLWFLFYVFISILSSGSENMKILKEADTKYDITIRVLFYIILLKIKNIISQINVDYRINNILNHQKYNDCYFEYVVKSSEDLLSKVGEINKENIEIIKTDIVCNIVSLIDLLECENRLYCKNNNHLDSKKNLMIKDFREKIRYNVSFLHKRIVGQFIKNSNTKKILVCLYESMCL